MQEETIKNQIIANIRITMLSNQRLYSLNKEDIIKEKERVYEIIDIIERYFSESK